MAINSEPLLIVIPLILIGIVAQYSAADGSIHPWAARQLVFATIGVLCVVALRYISSQSQVTKPVYSKKCEGAENAKVVDVGIFNRVLRRQLTADEQARYAGRLIYTGYFGSLALLVIVIVAGTTKMGATRWLSLGPLSVQPSEFARLSMILAVSLYMRDMNLSNNSHIEFYLIPILMVVVPVLMVFCQPHLGNSILMLFTGAGMIIVAGFSIRVAAIMTSLSIASLPAIWIFFLKNYQKTRAISFLHPEKDPLGAGYNVIQSEIAVGSGGMFGKGLLHGSQTHLGFLPEKHTDFIFTIIAEEFGFLGCALVSVLFFALIARLINTALDSQDRFIKLTAFGVALSLFLQTYMNISMTLGMAPVVGVPLPFLSYGGSSCITSILGVGIATGSSLIKRTDKNH